MAIYFTTIGAMLVPLGVLLAGEASSWRWLAIVLILTGLFAVVTGLIFTFREVRQKRKEDEFRIKREMASLKVLTFIADAFDIDAGEILEAEERRLDEK